MRWPIDDVTRFQREKSLPNRKRPDRILTLDDGDKIFVEAKRLGFIEQLSEVSVLAKCHCPAWLQIERRKNSRP